MLYLYPPKICVLHYVNVKTEQKSDSSCTVQLYFGWNENVYNYCFAYFQS